MSTSLSKSAGTSFLLFWKALVPTHFRILWKSLGA